MFWEPDANACIARHQSHGLLQASDAGEIRVGVEGYTLWYLQRHCNNQQNAASDGGPACGGCYCDVRCGQRNQRSPSISSGSGLLGAKLRVARCHAGQAFVSVLCNVEVKNNAAVK